MRHAARASIFVVAAGCAEQRPPAPPTPSRHAVESRWERFAEARSWPLAAPPSVARGHAAGEYIASVRVPSAYRDAYRGLVAGERWPVGMSIAAFHERRADHEPGSIYAMTKLPAGDWEYVVAAPDGVVESRGTIDLCARCHADAPADSLFGVSARVAESPEPPSRLQEDQPAP
jgi:hypothetical protein